MKLVIYYRFRPEVAHLIDALPSRTLCGRLYPSSFGPQTIFTDNLRLCKVCEKVIKARSQDG